MATRRPLERQGVGFLPSVEAPLSMGFLQPRFPSRVLLSMAQSRPRSSEAR